MGDGGAYALSQLEQARSSVDRYRGEAHLLTKERDDLFRECQRLREALERLATDACFTTPFVFDIKSDLGKEYIARRKFARAVLEPEGPKEGS